MNIFDPIAYRKAVWASDLRMPVKAVALALSEFSSKDRADVWPSLDTLGEMTGQSETTIKRPPRTLAKAGMPTQHKRQQGRDAAFGSWTLIDDQKWSSMTKNGRPKMVIDEQPTTKNGPDRRPKMVNPPTPPLIGEETREETNPSHVHMREEAPTEQPAKPQTETTPTRRHLVELWGDLLPGSPAPYPLRREQGHTIGQLSSALYALAEQGEGVKSFSGLYRHLLGDTSADDPTATVSAIREAWERSRRPEPTPKLDVPNIHAYREWVPKVIEPAPEPTDEERAEMARITAEAIAEIEEAERQRNADSYARTRRRKGVI